MKALNHNFETKDGIINLAELIGYTECMNNILEYLNSTNEKIVLKRELKDLIYATNDELIKLTPDKSKPDPLFEQIAQIVKTDAKIRYNVDL